MGNFCINVGHFFHLKINHNLQYVLQANSFIKIHFSRMLINDYDVIFDTTKKFVNR